MSLSEMCIHFWSCGEQLLLKIVIVSGFSETAFTPHIHDNIAPSITHLKIIRLMTQHEMYATKYNAQTNVVLHRLCTSSQEHIHTLHNKILFRIIRMLLTRDFQNSGNRLIVIFQYVTQIVRYMLINENNSNIIPLSECLECVFDDIGFGILLYGKEVARVGCSMTNTGKEESGYRILIILS